MRRLSCKATCVTMHPLSWFERVLVAIGCGCLTVCGLQVLEAQAFQQNAAQVLGREIAAPAGVSQPAIASGSLAGFMDAGGPKDAVIGRLEVPRLHLSVIVMEGDDEATLARAAGHLPGTAFPWELGNAVVAGHRDTFFRPLQNRRGGDEIRSTTVPGTYEYHVTSTEVVTPDDVAVLAPTPTRSLTLVTCYPFVYVGPAPNRFIIHAR
jgi:sortase A